MRGSVVPKIKPLTEERFHAIFLRSLGRLIAEHGEGEVALWLGVSTRQLRNIKAGSLPTADKIWNLLAHDLTAHDELDRQFGVRNTPLDISDIVDALPSTTAAVHKLCVARSADSPGGDRITHTELLDLEPEVDAAIRALTALKAQCERARAT